MGQTNESKPVNIYRHPIEQWLKTAIETVCESDMVLANQDACNVPLPRRSLLSGPQTIQMSGAVHSTRLHDNVKTDKVLELDQYIDRLADKTKKLVDKFENPQDHVYKDKHPFTHSMRRVRLPNGETWQIDCRADLEQ